MQNTDDRRGLGIKLDYNFDDSKGRILNRTILSLSIATVGTLIFRCNFFARNCGSNIKARGATKIEWLTL